MTRCGLYFTSSSCMDSLAAAYLARSDMDLRLVIGRFALEVDLRTDDVTGTETDVEHTGHRRLLGVPGCVGESPREDDRRQGLVDL